MGIIDKKTICLLLFSVLCTEPLSALVPTDSISAVVRFRCGSSEVDRSYRGNAAELEALISEICSAEREDSLSLRYIHIVAGASVEGGTTINTKLSAARALQIRSCLQRHFSLPDSVFSVSSLGEDWEGLRRLVQSSDISSRTEILAILRDIPGNIPRDHTATQECKRQLMALRNGEVWNYMLRHFMPELRRGLIICEIGHTAPACPVPLPEREEEPSAQQDSLPKVLGNGDTARLSPISTPCGTSRPACGNREHPHRCIIAVKSNLLYDIALIPNLGLEISLGKGWSIGGGWQYAWWKNDRHHNYRRTYGGELNIRKYFSSRPGRPLAGHHAGMYLHSFTYDFETGARGYLSRFSYGTGIEYGYSFPVGFRFSLDLSLGVGYLESGYEQYIPIDTHYVWQRTGKFRWFGPTKMEVALIWLLGKDGYDKKGNVQ